MTNTPAEPRPSATVILLRTAGSSLELLLLQRARRDGGSDGAWVFPGGRVESDDKHDAGDDAMAIARRAGIRETREEAGVDLSDVSLQLISRWITPELASKRFDTWFFAGEIDVLTEVEVDGQEIRTHRWLSPQSALAMHHEGELRLPPPTFVTISWLQGHRSPSATLSALAQDPILTFRPRVCPVPDGACMLYPGDAGYESADPDRPGARHRLWTGPTGMRYERS